MAELPIWQGNATWDTGLTSFGHYDTEDVTTKGEYNLFQDDAPLVADWCAKRLGYPLVDIELTDANFFTAFEEAVTEYGAQIYQFQIINNFHRLKGWSTGSEGTENGLNQIDLSDTYGSSEGGGQSVGGGYSGGGGGSYGEKIYSASLDVKQSKQNYDLLSSSPGKATTTITFGPKWTEGLAHSSSIKITDTKGTTVFYRATKGLSNGGYNNSMGANDYRNLLVGNMTTGSGEFRRYRHVSASIGEFVTGSYGGYTGEDLGNPNGLDDIAGSAGNSPLSASFDSFISTLTHPNGVHFYSFDVSSSYNENQTEYYAHITQRTEGTEGNTTVELNDDFTTNNPNAPISVENFTGGSSGLNFELSGSAIQAKTKKITIKKIYHYQPAAINRYFDPYAGTGTGIQSLMQTFGFGNYSPGVNFMLMPMYFDALKLQAIEMNDKIRKSAYHFELNSGRYLKLFPIPTKDYTLWFDYTIAASSQDLTINEGADPGEDPAKDTHRVTDMSNAPYKRPRYSYINEPGRQWIRKYTLALCKEMLGSIRGKYQLVPIPGSDTTLDYSRLLDEARTEKELLVTQLREDLDATSTVNQQERAGDESEGTQRIYGLDNPYQIYIH